MTPPTTDTLDFEAPGPGSWARDPVHFPRPASGYWVDTHPAAFQAGTEQTDTTRSEAIRRYFGFSWSEVIDGDTSLLLYEPYLGDLAEGDPSGEPAALDGDRARWINLHVGGRIEIVGPIFEHQFVK